MNKEGLHLCPTAVPSGWCLSRLFKTADPGFRSHSWQPLSEALLIKTGLLTGPGSSLPCGGAMPTAGVSVDTRMDCGGHAIGTELLQKGLSCGQNKERAMSTWSPHRTPGPNTTTGGGRSLRSLGASEPSVTETPGFSSTMTCMTQKPILHHPMIVFFIQFLLMTSLETHYFFLRRRMRKIWTKLRYYP